MMDEQYYINQFLKLWPDLLSQVACHKLSSPNVEFVNVPFTGLIGELIIATWSIRQRRFFKITVMGITIKL